MGGFDAHQAVREVQSLPFKRTKNFVPQHGVKRAAAQAKRIANIVPSAFSERSSWTQ